MVVELSSEQQETLLAVIKQVAWPGDRVEEVVALKKAITTEVKIQAVVDPPDIPSES